jgi:hypothetical protein
MEIPNGGHYAVMKATNVWLKDVKEVLGDLGSKK